MIQETAARSELSSKWLCHSSMDLALELQVVLNEMAASTFKFGYSILLLLGGDRKSARQQVIKIM